MSSTVIFGKFEWDMEKEEDNIQKHELDFYSASLAFLDPHRVIAIDEKHSAAEERLFCIGRIGRKIATVRFTKRKDRIRIIGAGFWRAGKKLYEDEKRN
jgi:hypothetical protein